MEKEQKLVLWFSLIGVVMLAVAISVFIVYTPEILFKNQSKLNTLRTSEQHMSDYGVVVRYVQEDMESALYHSATWAVKAPNHMEEEIDKISTAKKEYEKVEYNEETESMYVLLGRLVEGQQTILEIIFQNAVGEMEEEVAITMVERIKREQDKIILEIHDEFSRITKEGK